MQSKFLLLSVAFVAIGALLFLPMMHGGATAYQDAAGRAFVVAEDSQTVELVKGIIGQYNIVQYVEQ